MKKKIIILHTLLTIISPHLFAQDKLAANILEEVILNNNYTNITIDFDLIFQNPYQNINTIQKGTLIIQDQNFILELENQKIINNGEHQWIYLKEMNEVQIIQNNPEENQINPYNIIKNYNKEYKYKYLGKSKEKSFDIIALYPKKSNYLKQINIIINRSKKELKELIIDDKDGGKYTYLIKNINGYDEELNIFYFKEELYPDVEVIDLR